LVGLGSPREFESPPRRLFLERVGNYQHISAKRYLFFVTFCHRDIFSVSLNIPSVHLTSSQPCDFE
ncbi:MAG: hypothetical protein K8R34_04350, partial [Methanosarcinales archaeon]|nr:hypothetical protein [Methanosarcinales archaeon]